MNNLLTQTESIRRDESSEFEEALERNLENISDNASSFGDEEEKFQNNELDDILPPPAEMFESTLSLDDLPPPPSQSELPIYDNSELSCSSLSLASLPPFPAPVQDLSPKSDLSSPVSSGGATPINTFSPDLTPTNRSPALSPPAVTSPKVPPKPFRQNVVIKNAVNGIGLSTPYYSQINQSNSPVSPRKVAPKKISFNCVPEEIPISPKKPPPPKRSESTRLTTSPKKIASKESTLTPPPKDFLKDLQRVMRKKWQVAQKCKLDTSTTPHEVLGFRDPPPAIPDYKETNVSNWVKEHYGNTENNLYENVYLAGCEQASASQRPNVRAPTQNAFKSQLTKIDENSIYYGQSSEFPPSPVIIASKKRPPPPPPKRSETTQLTTRLH